MPTVVLDVNETLLDLAPVTRRFADVGLAPHDQPTWFASVLRDGFALAVTGEVADFLTLAAHHLHALRDARGLDPDEGAVGHVVDAFSQLDVHDDVAPALAVARERGARVVTLTNGAAEIGRGALHRSGLDVDEYLEAADSGVWKPHPRAYRHAAERLGADTYGLVAVHPWDVHGAVRAGWAAGWVARDGQRWPDPLARGTVEGGALDEVVADLVDHLAR